MSEERQHVIKTITHSGKSLLLTLTNQLKNLGVGAGSKVSVTWDKDEIVVRRADKQ